MADEELTGEALYDAEIAPALMALATRCQEKGMSLVAVVEYAPDERGSTRALDPDSGLEMRMIDICSRTVPNVDAYAISLFRHAKKMGIDYGGSLVLKFMAGEISPAFAEGMQSGKAGE